MEKDTTVEVSGDVRRGAALVEGVPIGLRRVAGGTHKGSKPVPIERTIVSVTVNLVGEAGASFVVTTTVDGLGSAKRRGRMTNDVAIRFWDIPRAEFKNDDDDDDE